MVLIASATSKSVARSALRPRECETRFGCTPSCPFLGGQRATIELRGSNPSRFGQHSGKARWAVRPSAASGRAC